VSISLRSRIRRGFLLGCVSGAALLSLAVGGASAATYGGSTFTGSAEGWKVAASPEQSCKLLNLLTLCENSAGYDGTAGAPPGSLAVKTNILVNVIGLVQSDLTAESPAFTAVGTGSGTLALARSFDPGGLLSLTPQYTYTAYLVDKTSGTKQKAFSETLEAEAPFANKTGAVSLTAGHTYVVQLETATSASLLGLGLISESIARFDNVSVTGPDAPTNPNGPENGNNGNNGNNGGNGNGGGNGSTGGNGANGGTTITSSELKSIAGSVLSGSATLSGNRVSVKGTCPTKAGATCTISLQGMLNRHKAATAGRKAKVKQGKSKNFALSVKPAARTAVKAKSKLLFKVTIKAGSASATAYKTLTLVHK
jgi:hypothetical protein